MKNDWEKNKQELDQKWKKIVGLKFTCKTFDSPGLRVQHRQKFWLFPQQL
jgi:hypothetical protein